MQLELELNLNSSVLVVCPSVVCRFLHWIQMQNTNVYMKALTEQCSDAETSS